MNTIIKCLLLLPLSIISIKDYAQVINTSSSQPLDTLVNQLENLIISDTDSTLLIVGDVIQRARDENQKLTEIKLRRIQVSAMWLQGQYELALDSIGNTMNLVDNWKNKIAKEDIDSLDMLGTTVINEKGRLYARLGKHQKAIDTYQSLIDNYSKKKQSSYIKKKRAMLNINMAISYKAMGTSLDSVLVMYEKGLKIFRELGDPYYISGMCLNMGISLELKGEYQKALTLYLEGLALTEKNNLAFQSNLYLCIISIYKRLKDIDEALKYGKKGLEYLEEKNNPPMKAHTLIAVGTLYSDRQLFDSAQYYFDESLKISTKQNDPLNQADAYQQIAHNLIEQGQFMDALHYIDLGVTVMENRHDPTVLLQLALWKARCKKELGDLKEALSIINQTLNKVEKYGNNIHKRNAYKIAQEVYSTIGNYSKAYQYLNHYTAYQDSVLSDEKTLEIARTEYKFQLKTETERLNLEKQQQAELYEKELEKKQLILQASIICGIMGLFTLFILYRSNQLKKLKNSVLTKKNIELSDKNHEINNLRKTEKKMAEETIALKERELTTVTMLSHERNTLLTDLGKQINNLSDKVDKEVTSELLEIKRTIKSNINNEKSWASFMYQFEKVHPDFFNQLKSKFPNITQNDLRLCAYIKIGMDNKEIASISNVAIPSVKKSINRLKKKMELDVDIDLRTYISTF